MKKTAVIGAGPAGIEAAAVLAGQGHRVVLFEKNSAPLCHLADKACLFPNFVPAAEVAERLLQRLQSPRIELRAGCEVSSLQPACVAGFQGEDPACSPVWKVGDELFDAVLLATGYRLFDARRKEELGYGIYPGVRTSVEMERMLREGAVVGATGQPPRRAAFLQCVGSRDEKIGNRYCSKLCCVTAVKQAIELRRLLPGCETYLFYMDLRMWGQGFEELYRQAQEEYGVTFVRGRVSEVGGTFDSRLQLKSEDTLMGLPLKLTADLLVLMVGMESSDGTRLLGSQCRVCGDYGFVATADPHLSDNATARRRLFAAGACKRPMTLADTLADARSAALALATSF